MLVSGIGRSSKLDRSLVSIKLRKPKADTKGPADLDDYDSGEADDDTEYETEEDESDARSDSVDD